MFVEFVKENRHNPRFVATTAHRLHVNIARKKTTTCSQMFTGWCFLCAGLIIWQNNMFFQAAVAGPKLHPFSTWSMLVRFFQICWCSIELKTVTLSSTCFLVHPEVNKISLCLLKKIFRHNPAFVATTSHRLHVHTKVFELCFFFT